MPHMWPRRSTSGSHREAGGQQERVLLPARGLVAGGPVGPARTDPAGGRGARRCLGTLPFMEADPTRQAGGGLPSLEITRTECKGCGSEVMGLNGRFACTLCGWCNHWSEGLTALPSAEDDPDFPEKQSRA